MSTPNCLNKNLIKPAGDSSPLSMRLLNARTILENINIFFVKSKGPVKRDIKLPQSVNFSKKLSTPESFLTRETFAKDGVELNITLIKIRTVIIFFILI